MQMLFPYTLFNLTYVEISNMGKTHLKFDKENTKTSFNIMVYHDINSWTIYQRVITDPRGNHEDRGMMNPTFSRGGWTQ